MESIKNRSITEIENYQANLLKDDEWGVSKRDQPWVTNDGPSYAARSIYYTDGREILVLLEILYKIST